MSIPSASSGSTPPSGENARRDERLPCAGAIEVLPCKPKGEWKFAAGDLVNCSRHGISMRFREPMQPNEQFLVKLKLDAVQLLVFSVRWCMAAGPDYLIGAEFAGFSSAQFNEEDANAMLQAFLKQHGTEGKH
jgi:hypothetical protein